MNEEAKKAKEILMKQLELLHEASKNEKTLPEDLTMMSETMVRIGKAIMDDRVY